MQAVHHFTMLVVQKGVVTTVTFDALIAGCIATSPAKVRVMQKDYQDVKIWNIGWRAFKIQNGMPEEKLVRQNCQSGLQQKKHLQLMTNAMQHSPFTEIKLVSILRVGRDLSNTAIITGTPQNSCLLQYGSLTAMSKLY